MGGRLILCATAFEMAPFLAQFPSLVKQTWKSGSTSYALPDSETGKTAWSCLITGPGVFNTATGLAAYLEHHTPELIMDTGFAGAYAMAGIDIGDVAAAVRERYIHTGVGNASTTLSPLPFDLIPGDEDTRSGVYRLTPEPTDVWLNRCGDALSGENCRIVKGDFLTVSAITRGDEAAGKLHQAFSPVMEAMEGAAAVHTAGCYNIPVIEIRAASNLAGERDKAKWDFDLAARRVQNICNRFIG
ncbi:MAG TPA: futalosine hydrolase [Desulfobacteraceae bacterium]|nr:futalosine hydrolase [Desulfobacteraceae bacterium]